MKYIVKSPILHNGIVFKIGEEIELDEEEAKGLQDLIEANDEQEVQEQKEPKEQKRGGKKE